MFSFAKMAYLTPKTTATELAKNVDSAVISASYYDIDDTQFYIVELPEKTIVTFRGTSTVGDAADDARAYLINFHDFGCKIHKGFNDQFKDSIDPLTLHLRELKRDRDIYFIGHSLGGALATVASLYFTKKYSFINIHVHTYGSPRVGDYNFAKLFNASVKSSKRYVNQNDIVTYAPWFFFVHVGGEINLGKKRSDLRSYYLGRLEDHYLHNYEKNMV